jgi:hypothetical protein
LCASSWRVPVSAVPCGTLDNFARGSDGYFRETTRDNRIAVSDYFVARTGLDGNHRLCMVDVGPGGEPALDNAFRDEYERTPCVDFNRARRPHGQARAAKPHSELCVVAGGDLR